MSRKEVYSSSIQSLFLTGRTLTICASFKLIDAHYPETTRSVHSAQTVRVAITPHTEVQTPALTLTSVLTLRAYLCIGEDIH